MRLTGESLQRENPMLYSFSTDLFVASVLP